MPKFTAETRARLSRAQKAAWIRRKAGAGVTAEPVIPEVSVVTVTEPVPVVPPQPIVTFESAITELRGLLYDLRAERITVDLIPEVQIVITPGGKD